MVYTLRGRTFVNIFKGASFQYFDAVQRGTVTLMLGQGLARGIGVAAIPVLTRLYSPEDFGALSLFTALVLIVAPLVTLRYVVALPLPRQDGTAMNLLMVAAVLMVGLTSLLAATLWIWGAPLLRLLSMEALAPWWWLIALGVLGTAGYELLTFWATRQRAYKMMAQTQVAQSAVGSVVKIGLGLISMQPLGLLIGQVVAQTGGITRLLRGFMNDFRTNWHHVRPARMRLIAMRHKGFPIWRVPSQFLMVFSMQAPVLFMAALYDTGTTGQFGLAVMALTIPVTVIGQSAGNALYGEAAKLMQTDSSKVEAVAMSVQKRLFVLAIIPATILFFYGDRIFAVLFGVEWMQAGRFASMLSIAVVVQFTSAPLVRLMNLLPRQSTFLVMNLIRVVGVLCVFQAAELLMLGPDRTVLCYAIYTALFYLGMSFYVIFALRKEVARLGTLAN